MQMIPFRYNKVRVKPLDWFKTNCVCDEYGYGYYGSDNIVNYINDDMLEYCDKEVTITGYRDGAYLIAEDGRTWAWDKWMFENKEKEVKEESRTFVDLQKIYTIDLTREDGVAELTYDSSDEHMKYLASKKLLFKTKEEARDYIDGVIVF